MVHLVQGTPNPAIPVTNSTDFEAALAEAGYTMHLTLFDGDHEVPPPTLSAEIFTDALGL